MKKSKKVIIVIFSIICIIAIIIIGYKVYEYCTEFQLDNVDKYLVVTDNKFYTMLSDGGSHVDVYYGIDLKEKKVTKYCDVVRANMSKIIQINTRTIEFNKNLTENDISELRELLSYTSLEEYNEEYRNEKEKKNTEKSIGEELNSSGFDLSSSYYYTVSNMNYGEIKVYGENFKEKFLDIVEKE